jgi:CheY-like chemotaxis protein
MESVMISPTNKNNSKMLTALVADDDKSMRALVSEIVAMNGLDVVHEAQDGHQAVEHFRRLRPNLVCLDLNMPGMNGLEALEVMRAENSQAVILLITGEATTAVRERAEALGINGIIPKPFQFEHIASEIRRNMALY